MSVLLHLLGLLGGEFDQKRTPAMRSYQVIASRKTGIAAAKRKAKKLRNIRRERGRL